MVAKKLTLKQYLEDQKFLEKGKQDSLRYKTFSMNGKVYIVEIKFPTEIPTDLALQLGANLEFDKITRVDTNIIYELTPEPNPRSVAVYELARRVGRSHGVEINERRNNRDYLVTYGLFVSTKKAADSFVTAVRAYDNLRNSEGFTKLQERLGKNLNKGIEKLLG